MTVFFLLAIIGCDGVDDDNDSDGSDNQTYAPVINSISLEISGYTVYPYEAYVGQNIVPVVTFLDRDKDLRTLYMDYYHESDNFTTPLSTQQAPIPPTNNPQFIYIFWDDSYVATAPTGFWKIRFYAVDDAGNESNDYELDLLVR